MAIETRTPAHSAIPTAESGLNPQHPRATGKSFSGDEAFKEDDSDLIEDVQERGRRLAAAGERYAQSNWDSSREALQDGTRHARQWARRHPGQLWAAVGALGLFAIWMAYRPTVNAIADRRSDQTRYRARTSGIGLDES
jgi:hypothetical protein